MFTPLGLVAGLLLLMVGQPPRPPEPAAKQTFRWNFREDDKFQLETTTEVKQLIRVTGQEEVRQEQRYVLLATYTVKQKDSENTVLEQRIDSVKVMLPTGVAAGKFYQELEGTVLRLTLNKKNELTRLEGYEELLRKVSGDDPSARRVVQAILPEETLRKAIEASISFLPTEEVAPGQTWERKLSSSLGPVGTLNVTNVYTYAKTETEGGRLLHVFTVQPQISYVPPRGDATGLPIQITGGEVKAEGAEGALWWDASEGRLARSMMKLKLAGKLKLKSKEQEATMDLENEQLVEIRLVKPTN